MNLKRWFDARGARFVWQRGTTLLGRYGVMPHKAVLRIECCLETLAELGCAPTFPTPGIVVQHHPQFFRRVQAAGAEIAVHGYQHIDLNALPLVEAVRQLSRAVQTFEQFGLEVHGFRCPYIGCGSELMKALRPGLFEYSSNSAIHWDLARSDTRRYAGKLYDVLDRFYRGRPASKTICVPWKRCGLLEIPICVPDDLQLHDGLHLCPEDISQVWGQMLHLTHRRGELLTLLTHPELASVCDSPLADLLREARRLRPSVWIARLRDIADWWREKSSFRVEVTQTSSGLRLCFVCSPRATILARGLGPYTSGQLWDGTYDQLPAHPLDVPAEPLPFVGLPVNAPVNVVSVLENQGYIVDASELAPRCGVYLGADMLSRLTNDVQLINYVEESAGPLVRYWRWPDGAKSALCITGDLDALTLLDYVTRLVW